jgi:hypothetical protein
MAPGFCAHSRIDCSPRARWRSRQITAFRQRAPCSCCMVCNDRRLDDPRSTCIDLLLPAAARALMEKVVADGDRQPYSTSTPISGQAIELNREGRRHCQRRFF